jgi:opacity protein-like surface antigen
LGRYRVSAVGLGNSSFQHRSNLTRDQQGEAFLDVILEGPAKWKIRPVLEVFYDKVWTQTETYSVLAGAIWPVRDNLSLDAGFRYALVDGHLVNEIRAGLTFAFDVGGVATKPGATFKNRGLSH